MLGDVIILNPRTLMTDFVLWDEFVEEIRKARAFGIRMRLGTG